MLLKVWLTVTGFTSDFHFIWLYVIVIAIVFFHGLIKLVFHIGGITNLTLQQRASVKSLDSLAHRMSHVEANIDFIRQHFDSRSNRNETQGERTCGLDCPCSILRHVDCWRGWHTVKPTDLSDEEAAAFWFDMIRVSPAILEVNRPLKMNYQLLGNRVVHLHWILAPRSSTMSHSDVL